MRQAILPVMLAVPDLPGTEIIQESTGHGPGGEFHERCYGRVPVPEWREGLVCSKCGSRDIDMVITGTEAR